MKSTWVVLSVAILGHIGMGRGQAVVEIADLWGTVNLRQGQEPLEVTCQATDFDRSNDHEFLWTLDSLPVSDDQMVGVNDERYRLTSVLTLRPSVEMDAKELACKYIERDDQGGIVLESEDSIELRVSLLELPSSPFNAGSFDFAMPVKLTVPFKAFPEINKEHVVWLIVNEEGEERRIGPGEKDDIFTADNVAVIESGKHHYEVTLHIQQPDHPMALASYYLLLDHQDGLQRVGVNFTRLEVEEETSPRRPASGAAQLGTGLYVILGLIVLVLAICIGYCVYKKFCRSHGDDDTPNRPNTTRISENKAYQAAPIKDEASK